MSIHSGGVLSVTLDRRQAQPPWHRQVCTKVQYVSEHKSDLRAMTRDRSCFHRVTTTLCYDLVPPKCLCLIIEAGLQSVLAARVRYNRCLNNKRPYEINTKGRHCYDDFFQTTSSRPEYRDLYHQVRMMTHGHHRSDGEAYQSAPGLSLNRTRRRCDGGVSIQRLVKENTLGVLQHEQRLDLSQSSQEIAKRFVSYSVSTSPGPDNTNQKFTPPTWKERKCRTVQASRQVLQCRARRVVCR
ncbi:hypothetical protein F2P81_003138 [Scophthalmus maximus]|uniref:Uncharacterized protein n=1 Tax=Scophthalmus maximus TaxID=52904 RepID=A0A6A4TK08_SCOMX|nr:hypothetical protein F2P81_003138 [Scophthalmus maximus]